MLDASVSGSPPGSPAPTLRVGKSIDGRSLTGRAMYASTPKSAMASISRLVAIGRPTNGSEMFNLQNHSHYLFHNQAVYWGHAEDVRPELPRRAIAGVPRR